MKLLKPITGKDSNMVSISSILDDILRKDKKLGSMLRQATAGDDLLFPTGFDLLDYKNGKSLSFHDRATGEGSKFDVVGVTGGSMIMIVGNTNVGKSTIAGQIAYNITKNYPASATFYFDIEKGFSDDRFMQINKIGVSECKEKFRRIVGKITTESLLKALAETAKVIEANRDIYEVDTGMDDALGRPVKFIQPTVFVIDSVKTLSSSTAVEDEIEGSTVGGRIAKEITQFVVKAQPIISSANIILLFINHINSALSLGTPKAAETIYGLKQDESISGGKALKYLCSSIFRFDTSGALKITKDKTYAFDGHFTIGKSIKTRSNKAGQEVKLAFIQGEGFMNDLSNFEFLVEQGVITGTQRRTVPGYPKSLWLKEVIPTLESDPALKECLDILMKPFLHEMLSSYDEAISEEPLTEEELSEIMNEIEESLGS
ncbi:MAG: hypothetical protein ACRC0G_07285 [Fusobacteriaceae bacterium]